jgi:hypothetical protein
MKSSFTLEISGILVEGSLEVKFPTEMERVREKRREEKIREEKESEERRCRCAKR